MYHLNNLVIHKNWLIDEYCNLVHIYGMEHYFGGGRLPYLEFQIQLQVISSALGPHCLVEHQIVSSTTRQPSDGEMASMTASVVSSKPLCRPVSVQRPSARSVTVCAAGKQVGARRLWCLRMIWSNASKCCGNCGEVSTVSFAWDWHFLSEQVM